MPAMPIRLRKLIGAVALITLVVVWALMAMALAQTVLTSVSGWIAARNGLGAARHAADPLDVAARLAPDHATRR